jgi:AraC family ethanolamine operon transcriptional activator
MQTHCFNDFDAFTESIGDLKSRMLLRNATRRQWSISSVDLDGFKVQYGCLGSGNIAQAEVSSLAYMLYLPLTDSVEYRANGTVLEEDSFAILEPGCEVCVSTKDAHDWLVVSIPSQRFDCDALSGSFPASQDHNVWVTGAMHQAARKYRHLLRETMIAAANNPQFESSPAAACVAAELLKIASSVIGNQQASLPVRTGRPPISREAIIACSRELIEQRNGEVVTVGDLAAAASVSERTLRNAFNEYFGAGPARYLSLRQLHQVKRALEVGDPDEISVSDVLPRYGVWEFGRFASRYRRMFGVLPSETLRATFR